MRLLYYFSKLGVILSQGHVWVTNRRFALKTLRDFGFGKVPILDDIIFSEANFLVQDLKKNIGKPITVDWSVNVAVLNVTWRLVASQPNFFILIYLHWFNFKFHY